MSATRHLKWGLQKRACALEKPYDTSTTSPRREHRPRGHRAECARRPSSGSDPGRAPGGISRGRTGSPPICARIGAISATSDMERLKRQLFVPLNFEMAATPEMIGLAVALHPHACLPRPREARGAHHRGRARYHRRGILICVPPSRNCAMRGFGCRCSSSLKWRSWRRR